MFAADVSVTEILEIAVDDSADRADDEQPPEMPKTKGTRNMQRLLHNKVECRGGNQQLRSRLEQLESAFLGQFFQ